MSDMTDAADGVAPPASGEPRTLQRVLSVVVAVVSRVAGLGLVFVGGADVIAGYASGEGFGAVQWLPVAAGLALIAITAATLLLSSLGLVVTSAVEAVIGFAGLIVPFAPGLWAMHPAHWYSVAYGFVLPAASGQAAYAVASGFLLVLGVTGLTVALAVSGRRRGRNGVSPLWRVIAMGSAVVISVPAVVLVWIGGNHLLGAYRAFVSSAVPLGPMLLLVLGVVLCAVIVATGRYSSAGLYAFGLLWITLWIALGGFLSSAPPSTETLLPQWLTRVGVAWALCGFSGILAVTYLVAGACERVLTRPVRLPGSSIPASR